MAGPVRVIFSDIDGTLVHYPAPGEFEDVELVNLPISSSGLQGVLSAGTLTRVQRLREAGIRFAIVSGARTKTVLQRTVALPAADAYVSENGGRIFYPTDKPDPETGIAVEEDLEWRNVHTSAGSSTQDSLPPEERQGILWDVYRQLVADGWKPDVAHYATCIRVPLKGGKTEEELKAVAASVPEGLQCTWNLGVADIYPVTSGKSAAAKYLMDKYGSTPADSIFLCDDDNDLELAALVAKAFLPSITHVNVQKAVDANPEHFVIATKKGPLATDEVLDAVGDYFGVDVSAPAAAVKEAELVAA